LTYTQTSKGVTKAMKDFKGKVAVITGAAHGFGREVALEAASRGMKLFLADIERSDLEKVTDELKEKGTVVAMRETDVTEETEVDALIKEVIAQYGQIDLLVNSAGIALGNFIWDLPTRDWEWIMHADFLSQVYSMKRVIPLILKQKTSGDIINVASVGGLTCGATLSAYAASKAASIAMTESVAYDLQIIKSDINLHVFCPAFYQTDLGNSEKRRPKKYAEPNDPYYQSDSYKNYLKQTNDLLANGASLETVGPVIFKGLEENKFIITTHKKLDPFIRERTEKHLNGQQPNLSLFNEYLPKMENDLPADLLD